MLSKLLDLLFGCTHKHMSRVWTRKWIENGRRKSKTYVICFDCYKELDYDWNQMAIVGTRRVKPMKQQPLRPVIEMNAAQREIAERKRMWRG